MADRKSQNVEFEKQCKKSNRKRKKHFRYHGKRNNAHSSFSNPNVVTSGSDERKNFNTSKQNIPEIWAVPPTIHETPDRQFVSFACTSYMTPLMNPPISAVENPVIQTQNPYGLLENSSYSPQGNFSHLLDIQQYRQDEEFSLHPRNCGASNDEFSSHSRNYRESNDEFSLHPRNCGASNDEFNSHSRNYRESNDEFSLHPRNYLASNDEFSSLPRYYRENNDEFSLHPRNYQESKDEFSLHPRNYGANNDEFSSHSRNYRESNDEFSLHPRNYLASNDEFSSRPRYYRESNDEFSLHPRNYRESNDEFNLHPRSYQASNDEFSSHPSNYRASNEFSLISPNSNSDSLVPHMLNYNASHEKDRFIPSSSNCDNRKQKRKAIPNYDNRKQKRKANNNFDNREQKGNVNTNYDNRKRKTSSNYENRNQKRKANAKRSPAGQTGMSKIKKPLIKDAQNSVVKTEDKSVSHQQNYEATNKNVKFTPSFSKSDKNKQETSRKQSTECPVDTSKIKKHLIKDPPNPVVDNPTSQNQKTVELSGSSPLSPARRSWYRCDFTPSKQTEESNLHPTNSKDDKSSLLLPSSNNDDKSVSHPKNYEASNENDKFVLSPSKSAKSKQETNSKESSASSPGASKSKTPLVQDPPNFVVDNSATENKKTVGLLESSPHSSPRNFSHPVSKKESSACPTGLSKLKKPLIQYPPNSVVDNPAIQNKKTVGLLGNSPHSSPSSFSHPVSKKESSACPTGMSKLKKPLIQDPPNSIVDNPAIQNKKTVGLLGNSPHSPPRSFSHPVSIKQSSACPTGMSKIKKPLIPNPPNSAVNNPGIQNQKAVGLLGDSPYSPPRNYLHQVDFQANEEFSATKKPLLQAPLNSAVDNPPSQNQKTVGLLGDSPYFPPRNFSEEFNSHPASNEEFISQPPNYELDNETDSIPSPIIYHHSNQNTKVNKNQSLACPSGMTTTKKPLIEALPNFAIHNPTNKNQKTVGLLGSSPYSPPHNFSRRLDFQPSDPNEELSSTSLNSASNNNDKFISSSLNNVQGNLKQPFVCPSGRTTVKKPLIEALPNFAVDNPTNINQKTVGLLGSSPYSPPHNFPHRLDFQPNERKEEFSSAPLNTASNNNLQGNVKQSFACPSGRTTIKKPLLLPPPNSALDNPRIQNQKAVGLLGDSPYFPPHNFSSQLEFKTNKQNEKFSSQPSNYQPSNDDNEFSSPLLNYEASDSIDQFIPSASNYHQSKQKSFAYPTCTATIKKPLLQAPRNSAIAKPAIHKQKTVGLLGNTPYSPPHNPNEEFSSYPTNYQAGDINNEFSSPNYEAGTEVGKVIPPPSNCHQSKQKNRLVGQNYYDDQSNRQRLQNSHKPKPGKFIRKNSNLRKIRKRGKGQNKKQLSK